ncbi:PREDICTED: pentatricopeptide repeat-containing protein At5g18390, mitochondrial [Tarenaya hassleriana]|uniref:pentatricopeptide repeat-containing protein At5g18390, mitochondrial n=1 Tax=Tarenaya hassleriana TaxID=28532 RepID=UPI00053C98D8|nr:PREDICTED: pentatricopeptide repeat-containing protein At5g18390, mitochondrial [Tarenaya hassleriana]
MFLLLRRPRRSFFSAISGDSSGFACYLRRFSAIQPIQCSDPVPTKGDYFAAISRQLNIVRREIHPEKALNRLRPPGPSEFVFRVLRAPSRSANDSIRFFNWARSNPSYTPTSMEFEEFAKTLASHQKYESMWKTLKQMKDLSLAISGETLCFIIEQYGKHGHVDQAVELFNRVPKTLGCEQTVEVYNALLHALCDVKMFHGAYALIRRMVRKGVKPDKRTYAILVNGWCSAGKMREAQEFLDEMSRKGFNPPARGRDLLIEGLLNAGYLESAKEMVKKMTKGGFVPDIETFNSLIEAVSNSGEVEFCIEMYYTACKLGLCMDINTYKILIPAASKIGNIEEAFRLLNNCVEDGHKPFPSLYAPIIKGMCRKGMFDDAFSFFSDMKVKAHPPNRPVYTMVITMCGRGGRYVDAANYLVEMTEVGLVPISRCFDMVTDGLKTVGKYDLAKRIEQLEVRLRGV